MLLFCVRIEKELRICSTEEEENNESEVWKDKKWERDTFI